MKFIRNKHFDWALLGIALLAAFLNMYGIWKDEYANSYYTAAVASMLQSWHNFFYASFDPGGFVTVDKPPVAFWVQTLSASLLGLHGWSVILPQALAGVGSVLLIYSLVKPSFGLAAARLAGLVAASTPIAVAVSRTNNVDSLLVFTLLAATWLLFKGVKTKKWLWVVAAFAVIGVGFNIKMLQAYMVLPAFYLFLLLAFKARWKEKLRVLVASSVVLLIVSFSWPVIVDSIPQENRPYIGSSQTNSVLELAFGYNGLSRLTGMGGPGGVGGGVRLGDERGLQDTPDSQQQWTQPSQQGSGPGQGDGGQMPYGTMSNPQGFQPGMNGNPGMNGAPGEMPEFDRGGAPGQKGGGGMFNTGQAGPLRLFQSELSGQASWLIPFALWGSVGLLRGIRKRQQLTVKQKESLFWLAWLLPSMVFFSMAGFFHSYYLIMLAPAIAALTGAGWVELFGFYHNREGWTRWLLPVGILLTTLFEIYVLTPYRGQIGLGWPVAVGTMGIGLSLFLALPMQKEKYIQAAALGGILVLLAAPLYWSATPLLYGGNSMLPEAGPQLHSSGNRMGMPGQMGENLDAKLLDYLTTHNTGEKYLFAATSSHTAGPYIIETGKAVMAMGGFSGSDPILTVEKLQEMVNNKEVKYFLISSGGAGGFGGGSSEVLTWIREHGREVPKEEWQASTGTPSGGMGRDGSQALYEVNPQ